jgi:glycosyltransferase involved in cell wall biosynthesis
MKRTKDVHWIPNGVDFDHFNNPANIKKDNKLKNITKPIVGYLGTIEERVDLDLIARVAKNHKDKIIALCGPVWPSIKPEFKKKLGKLENVLDFGRIPFDEAPSYVQTFNVTMIPHKLNQFVDTMNPMKMYDYLACGKPIVATSGAGINMFKEHIYIADDPEKFSEAIDQALAEDSPKKQEARQDAVKPHSWLARSTKMTELVYEKLKSK